MKREKPLLLRVDEVQPDGSRKSKAVRADEIKHRKTPFHDQLSADQVKRAEALWERIGKLARKDIAVAGWIDQFRFDMYPDDELTVWERIATTFERVDGPATAADDQRSTIRAILLVSMGAVDIEAQTGLSEAVVLRLRSIYSGIG